MTEMYPKPESGFVQVPDAPPPSPEMRDDGPRDLSPVIWGTAMDDHDDFRPLPVAPDASDPKGWSAAASADFSAPPVDPSPSGDLATTAPAEKASTPAKAPALSKPPS